MHSEKESEQKLDLFNLVDRFGKIMCRIWYVALVLVVLFSSVFYIREARSFTPMYECRVVFSVSSSYNGSDIFTTTYYDNAAAQQLASAFPSILSTDLMRDLIRQELGKSYINGNITATATENTNMLVLKVRSSSAQDAYDILRATVDSFPQVASFMVDNPQAVVMNEPEVPTRPVNAFSWKGPVVRGALIGFVLACGIGLALTFATRVVTSVDQLKAIANLPILAVLPKVTPKKRRGENNTIKADIGADPAMAESLRGMSLKLRKSLAGEKSRVILITSTVSGEGKTTVAANLARTLAEDGSRVIVVDADLRKQSIADQFGGKIKGKGLMLALSNPKNPVAKYMVKVDENLSYMSGASTSKTHYSIDTRRMRGLLDTLGKDFDYIVVDTPPCGVVADTMLLCHFATAVLYVVRPDRATEPQIVDNVTAMYERNVAVEGFIFNGQPRKHSRYGYGKYGYHYGYGYGSGYGYGYGKSRKKS